MELIKNAQKIIVSFHLRHSSHIALNKKDLWDRFLKKWVELIGQSESNIEAKANLISTLKQFLMEYSFMHACIHIYIYTFYFSKKKKKKKKIIIINIINKKKKSFEGKQAFECLCDQSVITVVVQKKFEPRSRVMIDLPRNTTILFLKHCINLKLQLNNDEFVMYLPNLQHTIRKDQEEDFAIKSIETDRKSDPTDIHIQVNLGKKDEDYIAQ